MTQHLCVELTARATQQRAMRAGDRMDGSASKRPRKTRSMERQTFRAIVGESGHLSYLFSRVCARMPGIAYARHVLVGVTTENMPSMPKGYSTRLLTLEDLADHRIDADAVVQAQRFAAGMKCLGIFNRADTLVGVTWLDMASHDEIVLGVRFRLPPGAAWDGGLWIDEHYRLSRAFVAIWAGTRHWLEQHGMHQSISSIADYNAASVAAHRSLGARVLRHVAVVRVGGIQITFGDRAWPRWSRLGRFPEIDLAP